MLSPQSIFLMLFIIPAIEPGKVHPVIFIPGDGGSQVDAKLNKPEVVHYICTKTTKDFFNIWLNMELLVPIVMDCWVDNMRLVYDNATRTTSNAPGVELRIPGWGDPFVVEWLDPTMASSGSYFKDIGNALTSLGWERNVSIRGAPYDFRKAPNENQEFFVKLKALVEETYKTNNNTPVVLLAHSMGGPMSLYFLHQQSQKWKDQYIRAMITLSGAWGGSVKAIKVYAVGDDLGVYVLRQSVLRNMQITAPSLAWLLPSSLFWKPNEVLVETYERNYTWSDMKDFFQDIEYEVAWEMWKDVYKFTLDFTAPGVEVHCLHGYNVQTVERLVYKKGKFPEGSPSFVFGDGDGTVNKRSLEGCLHWKGNQKQPVYHQTFPNMDHMDVLSDDRIIDYISKLFAFKL
ncbi:phospholipase A2 group XV-like [Macrosteles quadrilineatus]|uniref:phospholipase A2 group XV-like n=1 Tax=Macrosteles quadrilineatus TaxID=74068 RepID=UPI0023E0A3F6|nr:phospholipase A2 group XV-like [Macrosteles quadrilineatus]